MHSPVDPLVSVVVPAYNAAEYIRECIDSIFAQNYTPIEIIVVDDGSTDDTIRILAEYGDRISVISQKNQGAAVARNRGLARANGKYIAFLDSDDVWLPGKLRCQIEVLEGNPAIGLVFTRWRCWFSTDNGVYPPPCKGSLAGELKLPARSGWLYPELLLDCLMLTSAVMLRREVAKSVGEFDPALRRGQDYDYWLRASRLTQIQEIDREFVLYRIEDGASVRKAQGINWELQVVTRALERWGATGPDGRTLPKKALRKRLSQLHARFGYQQFHGRNFSSSIAAFASSLLYRPLQVRNYAYIAAACIGGAHQALLGAKAAKAGE